MPESKFSFGIREKLFLLILVLFGALILATFWQIGNQAEQVSAATIQQSLQQSRTVLDAKIESRFDTISEVAKSVARDSRILPLVYESESLSLQDQSQEFQRQLNFDILFFTDEVGNILARSDRPQAMGQNIAGRTEFFDAALSGQSGQGIFMSQGRLMQIVTEPIFDNVASDVVRGTVALAYEFTSELADEIVSLTFSDVGFFSFTRDANRQVDGVANLYVTDQSLSNSLKDHFAASDTNWKPIFNAESEVLKFQITLNDQDYYAIARSMSNNNSDALGFVMILRSSADLLAPFTQIQRSVLLIGGICLLVAFVFAGLVSVRISKPIINLVSVTDGIRNGIFPTRDSASKTRDEIGMLHRAVVDMGTSLKEKADLENYLSQLSNELKVDESLSNVTLGDSLGFDEEGEETQIKTHDHDATLVAESNADATPKSIIKPGTHITDRYQVIKLIGQGAVGQVYLVQDLSLGERVVLKLLPHEYFAQSNAFDIKEEIRLARRITHRNILRTFDMGSWETYTYISMEYVSGYDLHLLLRKRGAQEVYIALLMSRQICSAMIAAHEQGVIHLDLKPGNMMVNRQGILKIMDFGLARNIAISEKQLDAEQGAEIMGTPRYMAPEQFLNDQLDERTDIYSIGIILYTLINGTPPFTHEDYMKLAQMHIHDELPRITNKDTQLAGALEKIIRKASAKNPSDRFQSVQEMLEELNKV